MGHNSPCQDIALARHASDPSKSLGTWLSSIIQDFDKFSVMGGGSLSLLPHVYCHLHHKDEMKS